MRILLDECVHRKLKRELPDHDVRTVGDMKWKGIKNGKLLALASASFEVFVTVDRNLQFQQNLKNLHISVIVIHSHSVRWSDLSLHVESLRNLLKTSLEPKLYEIR